MMGRADQRAPWYERRAGKPWQEGEREPFTADLLPKQPRAELPQLTTLPPQNYQHPFPADHMQPYIRHTSALCQLPAAEPGA